MIPQRFMRVWLGPAKLEPRFEDWWKKFQELHPSWEFMTIGDDEARELVSSTGLEPIYDVCATYSGRSDVVRIAALYRLGGIYVDTDVMPLRAFDPLLEDGRAFAGKRSSKSFEAAILGSPAESEPARALVKALPAWYRAHRGRSCAITTGPAFISSVWWGRADVRHLSGEWFYPYNGFCGPKRAEKDQLFLMGQFPKGMFAAHYSGHRWGGRPK
jgi:mannosyltransferase OCH1-like enzyme